MKHKRKMGLRRNKRMGMKCDEVRMKNNNNNNNNETKQRMGMNDKSRMGGDNKMIEIKRKSVVRVRDNKRMGIMREGG